MKGLISKMLLMVGAVLTLGYSANAQMSQQYRGNIPFDFQVGGKQFAAGAYSIGPRSTHGSAGALILQERKGKRQMASLGLVFLKNSNSSNGKLIFVKRNGQYALSKVETPTFAVTMRRTWTDVKVARNDVQPEEIIAILLQ